MSEILNTVEAEVGNAENVANSSKLKTLSKDEIQAKAMQLREENKLPPVPGDKCSFEQSIEWAGLLTDDMWKRLAWYMYRMYPGIQRKALNPDQEIYIDFITKDQLTMDKDGLRGYILKKHGGGKYRFMINDLSGKKGHSNIITTYLNIPLDEAMPILNYEEIDRSNKINMGYLNMLVARGIMDGKGNMLQPGTTVVQSPDPSGLVGQVGAMYDKFITLFTQLNKEQQANLAKAIGEGNAGKNSSADSVTQLLLEKLKQDDPNKQLTVMTTLLNAVKEMTKGDSSNNSSDKLIEMMNQNHKFQTEMMGKMFDTMKEISANSSKKEGDGFFDGLIKFASIKEKLPELFGGGHSEGKKHIGEIIIDGVKELGLPVVGLVSQIIQAKTGAKPIVPVTPQQAQDMVDNRNLPPSPEEVRKFQGNTGQGGQGQERVVEMPNSAQPQLTPVVQLISSYGQLLVSSIRQGKKGAELAVQVVNLGEMVGTDFFAILEQQGKEGILQGMKSIPAFWQATAGIYGEPYMDMLIEDFLNYEEILAREEENEEKGESA